jgi:phenylalanyl-tRNA synthetase beta chain
MDAAPLLASGQRPINAVVDATNYLMLAFGRPAHAYDLAKLSGPLVARRAHAGEEIAALNGKTYRLDDTMTVIADDAMVTTSPGSWAGSIPA